MQEFLFKGPVRGLWEYLPPPHAHVTLPVLKDASARGEAGPNETDEIFVSVVIPTFGRSRLLSRCLISLLRQTLPYERYEIIIAIDGTDADTVSCIEAFAAAGYAIRYVSHITSKGPAAARNAGWQLAKGNLIVFTDDDCIADTRFLERYVEACGRSPRETAFFGRVIVPLEHPITDYKKNVKKLEVSGFITANCGCRKSVLELTGGFDEQYRAAWREDSDFYFSLLSSHIETIYLPSAIIIHLARKAQWGISMREQKKSRYNALLYKKFPHYFRKYVKKGPNWLYYCIVFSFFSGIICLAVTDTTIALICWSLWLLLTAVFIMKRLKGTSKSLRHISEMCVTSFCIPFLSIYWNLRGSLEFRTFYL